jgi:hypothetical protein
VQPTDAEPGSPEKIEVLRLRAKFCLDLHVLGDRMSESMAEQFEALNGFRSFGLWD